MEKHWALFITAMTLAILERISSADFIHPSKVDKLHLFIKRRRSTITTP
jgi:hypothetical protein